MKVPTDPVAGEPPYAVRPAEATGISADDLQHALASRELLFYYQPKVDMMHGEACGAEALLRWRRPDGTLVPPGAFIPMAERTGVITEITLAMFDELLSDMQAVRAADERLTVSFNASALDLEQDPLCTAIESAVRRGLVRPGRLELELTESSVLAAGRDVLERLSRLRQLDIRLAMDDFGTGFSSIDMLSKLPFTALKVDQGIVGRMLQSEKDAALVESSIRMGHRLGLEVVAEGIETEACYSALQSAGCTLGQGYFIGRPAPLEVFVALVRQQRRWPAEPTGLLHAAMLDHIEWRKSVIDILLAFDRGAFKQIPALAARSMELKPTECRLGRWYYGAGRDFAGKPAYEELEAAHIRAHLHGRQLLEHVTGRAERSDLLPIVRDLTDCSMRVLTLLQQLEHDCLERLVAARAPETRAPGAASAPSSRPTFAA